MPPTGVRDPESLLQIRNQLEAFLVALKDPVVLESGRDLIDLAAAEWRFSIEFGKLIFEAWSPARSISRRIEDVIDCEPGRMAVLARKAHRLEPTKLEFQERGFTPGAAGQTRRLADERSRKQFRQEFLAMLAREFAGWHFENVSNRSHREHSFSAWYTRGVAHRGSAGWAFLGLSEVETVTAVDAVLAFGLIWLDWLRGRPVRPHPVSIAGLKLFLPRSAVEIAAHRAAYLNPRAADIDIIEWNGRSTRSEPVDLKDYGNVATRLSACREGPPRLDRYTEILRKLLAPFDPLCSARGSNVHTWQSVTWGSSSPETSTLQRRSEYPPQRRQVPAKPADRAKRARESSLAPSIDITPDPGGNFISLRVCGLEVARIEGEVAPSVYFGFEGNWRRLQEEDPAEFHHFLNHVLNTRHADAPDASHELYRIQSERWLESLLVRDLTKIDPALLPEFVYPQVPAFTGVAQSSEFSPFGTDLDSGTPEEMAIRVPADAPTGSRMTRGVIDILSVARPTAPGAGYRLAVIELKVHEEINLPLQGLDYWLRVKWLQERDEFKRSGYFRGLEFSSSPPLLYFVCPAFRFHSTTEKLIRYLHPSVEVILVGINQTWRHGIKVLFRRELRNPANG
jgi:hypothetical protein